MTRPLLTRRLPSWHNVSQSSRRSIQVPSSGNPTEKKGTPVAVGLSSVELSQLKDTMEAISNSFTGLDGQLDALDQAEQDMYEDSL